jgi:very-short-patch-repair endonuclease
VRIGRYEVDFLFEEARVIVEVDSWAHHKGFDSFGRDRRKWDDLQNMGYRVVPITAHELKHAPQAAIARIAAAVALASAK